MWNTISGNRLIDRKRKQQAHRRHKLALNNIRSTLNNNPPRQYSFLYSRPKAQQLRYEREQDIQKQNGILVDRMMRCSSSNVRQTQDIFKQSLNSIYRSRVDKQIDQGNQKLVRRLQSVKSQYTQSTKGKNQYDKYKSNMAYSRMDPYYDMENNSQPIQNKPMRPFSAKR